MFYLSAGREADQSDIGNSADQGRPRGRVVTTTRLIYIYVPTQGIFIGYVTSHNLVKNINLNASISFTYNSRQNLNLTAGFFFRLSP